MGVFVWVSSKADPKRAWRAGGLLGRWRKHGGWVGKWDRKGKTANRGRVMKQATTEGTWTLIPQGKFGANVNLRPKLYSTQRQGSWGLFILQLSHGSGLLPGDVNSSAPLMWTFLLFFFLRPRNILSKERQVLPVGRWTGMLWGSEGEGV